MYQQNVWEKADDKKKKAVFAFAEDYERFLSASKTERLAVRNAVNLAKKQGYVSGETAKSVKAGDKLYFINKDKNVALFHIGKRPVKDGLRILGAHVDSPRLDLKQYPLYEDGGFALFDTHYYGGIKKYQWVTVPLALYGVICKKDGTSVSIAIGDKDGDPVFGVSDLLPHLAKKQMEKTGEKIVEGENLDVTVGSIPMENEDGESVKKTVLKILKDTYGVEEEDFLSAEIEVVPAGNARDYGLDRSMIAGYGHDDRVCAYASLRAILDEDTPEYTSCCILVDKEEIGSVGATGAESAFFENVVADVLALTNETDFRAVKKTFENSKMLSSDVSAAFDPLYPSVSDKQNGAYLGNGIVFNKYTGARGKSGSNDCDPEYFAWVRKVMDDAGLCFQTAELGKVDAGGGGTIAYILGNRNMDVVDAGVAVLNMHAPMEVVSKADVYESYLAYKAFLK